ncbi:hypothetical protein A2U01_0082429, partial [Trifolium medium]|nr:hypothetical protein [Trifolium medium]
KERRGYGPSSSLFNSRYYSFLASSLPLFRAFHSPEAAAPALATAVVGHSLGRISLSRLFSLSIGFAFRSHRSDSGEIAVVGRSFKL